MLAVQAIPVRSSPSREATVGLLCAAGLPSADLTEAHLRDFLFCGDLDAPSGVVGVELIGPDALLRSLVVVESARGSGLGSALVQEAERYAQAKGVRRLFLLTETAAGFFENRGYVRIARDQCPATIRATTEFTTLCPASSAVLSKQLPPLSEIAS